MSKDRGNQKLVPAIRFKGFTDDWKQRKLSDLGELNRGKSKHRPRNDPKLFGGEYPFVQTGDVAASGLYLSQFTQTLNDIGLAQSQLWPKGTILITIAANVADSTILAIDAAFPDSVIGFTSINSSTVFDKYLLDRASSYLKRTAPTGSQANLNLKSLSKLEVFIPKIEEQNQISMLLSRLDKSIALHQRKYENLQTVKKELLKRMFASDKKAVPDFRFKGFTDDWEQRKLGDYTSFITKGTTPRDKSGNGSINFVKVENISNQHISNCSKISVLEHTGYLKRSILQEGDILFSIAGTLGRTAMVEKSILPANTNQALAIIRNYDFDKGFLMASLTGYAVKDYIRKNPTTGAQPNLSLVQVGHLIISTPNRSEQQRIGSIFRTIDSALDLHQRKLEDLKQLKKVLLQKLFV